MVRQGMPTNSLTDALQALNDLRCSPPLESREVDQIARSAMTTSHGARELAQPFSAVNFPTAGAQSSSLSPVNVADIFISPSPPPDFIWEGLIPRGVVTLLGAHGGTGKSMMALMLAVSVALGRQLWGCPTKQVKALFLSLEDSSSVVRHRLANICKIWSIDPDELHRWLHIVDGTEYPELFVAEGRGKGELTQSYAEMVAMIEAKGIGFLIVDNASDAFGADEIQRRHVRGFIRSLTLAIRQTNAGCLLLAHVDKNTSRNQRAEGGEGYSGSTAWHNSARSRLFLVRENSGLLKLDHQKSNFGKKLEPIMLEWPEHGLLELTGSGGDVDGLLTQHQGRQDDEKVGKLLALIAEYESRSQYMASGTTSKSNPYAVMESDRQFQRLKLNRQDTKRLITQCHRAKWIEILEYKTPDRKMHQRWTLTNDGRVFAGLGAPTAPTSEDGA
jgi:putative DNA primase/helicase